MTVDKQSKIDDILDKAQERRRSIMKIMVICLLVVFVGIGGFIAYLQVNAFDTPQNRMSAADFYQETASDILYGDQGFVIKVPEAVIKDLGTTYIQRHLDEGKTVSAIAYDPSTQRLNMNFSAFGFYIPLSYQLDFRQLNMGIDIAYGDLRLGKGNHAIGDGLASLLLNLAGLSLPEEPQTLDFIELGLSQGLIFHGIFMEEGLPVLTFTADEDRLMVELEKVKAGVTPRLLDYYRTFDEERTSPVLELIDSLYTSDQQVTALINSLMGDKYLVSDLLLLAENYDVSGFKELLDIYGMSLDTERIANERKAFKGHAIDGDIESVFIALDQHFIDKMMAFNQGKPFDLEGMTTMTVKNLAAAYELAIDEELLEALTFVYDEAFKVAYRLDNDTYYIRSLSDYQVVSKATYEGYLGAGYYVEPYPVDTALLWDAVVSAAASALEVEDVFVRYMMTDGVSTFTVVSPIQDSQEYYGMAIQRINGLQTVLDQDVKVVASLIESHPDFNIATATKAIETSSFKRIGDDTFREILDQLYGQRKISSPSAVTIDYSAYDGIKYIAFMLSSGDEYVYKIQNTVYGSYLTDVYTKEKALRNWTDMPELLLLQDRPNK